MYSHLRPETIADQLKTMPAGGNNNFKPFFTYTESVTGRAVELYSDSATEKGYLVVFHLPEDARKELTEHYPLIPASGNAVLSSNDKNFGEKLHSLINRETTYYDIGSGMDFFYTDLPPAVMGSDKNNNIAYEEVLHAVQMQFARPKPQDVANLESSEQERLADLVKSVHPYKTVEIAEGVSIEARLLRSVPSYRTRETDDDRPGVTILKEHSKPDILYTIKLSSPQNEKYFDKLGANNSLNADGLYFGGSDLSVTTLRLLAAGVDVPPTLQSQIHRELATNAGKGTTTTEIKNPTATDRILGALGPSKHRKILGDATARLDQQSSSQGQTR